MSVISQVAEKHYVIPAEFKEKLEKALHVSWYGRNIFKGFHTYASQDGTFQKVKRYAAFLVGGAFAGTTTYFSFDGSVRMIQWSLNERDKGNPLPSDIGHGGEWVQQPFQYALAVHMYLLSALSNQGYLKDVEELYTKLIDEILAGEEGKDISELYQQFEADFQFLGKRSFSGMNLLQARLHLVELFKNVDTAKFPCEPLAMDRLLDDDYKKMVQKLKEQEEWTLSNIKENWKEGLSLMRKRGTVQTVEKGICFAGFQAAMAATSIFMVWGLTIVFDEVFLSKTGREASGHLAEWSINVLTNLALMYVIYSWLIKREAALRRTKDVMERHLRGSPSQDLESGAAPQKSNAVKNRLIEAFNTVLDGLAEKCHFNTLPSQYRLARETELSDEESSD